VGRPSQVLPYVRFPVESRNRKRKGVSKTNDPCRVSQLSIFEGWVFLFHACLFVAPPKALYSEFYFCGFGPGASMPKSQT
jgi:hypothetical protein